MERNSSIDNLMTSSNSANHNIMRNLYNQYIEVKTLANSKLYKVKESGSPLYYIVNVNGKKLMYGRGFDEIGDFNSKGISIAKSGTLYHIISAPCEPTCALYKIYDVEKADGVRIVKTTDGCFLFADSLRSFVKNCCYENIERKGKYFMATKQGHKLIINSRGKIIQTALYTEPAHNPREDYAYQKSMIQRGYAESIENIHQQIQALMAKESRLLEEMDKKMAALQHAA